MPIAMLMFLPPMGPATEVLEKYANWVSGHAAYAVKGEVTKQGGKDKLPFELRTQKPDSIWFRVHFGNEDYRMSKSAAAVVETEAGERVYDETEGFPGMRIMPSKISGLQMVAFPGWLVVASGKQLFPGEPTMEKATVDGRSVVMVHALQKSPEGEYEAWGWFNPDGSPYRFRCRLVNPQQTSDFTWTCSAFSPLSGKDPFALSIPNDYSPYRLPDPGSPYGIGTAVKLGVWKRGGGTVDLDAEAKGTVLFAILTPGEKPSQRIESALGDLEKDGLKVVRISDATRDPSMAYDPTGDLLSNLRAPATPYLMLLKEGKVAGLWLGAGENTKETADDVRAAIKG